MTDASKWPDSREFWKNKRVCVMRQHGAGFLGPSSSINCASTEQRDITDLPRRADYDLVQGDAIRRLLSDARPDVVIHLAARVGGIGANREHPAEFFSFDFAQDKHVTHHTSDAKRKSGIE